MLLHTVQLRISHSCKHDQIQQKDEFATSSSRALRCSCFRRLDRLADSRLDSILHIHMQMLSVVFPMTRSLILAASHCEHGVQTVQVDPPLVVLQKNCEACIYGTNAIGFHAASLAKQPYLLARLISALPFISPPDAGPESVPPLCAALLFMC